MRTLSAFLVAALVACVAAAQTAPSPESLTLEQALAVAPGASASVSAAQAALTSAERDDARVSSDPMSLRVDRITADNALTNAHRSLAAAFAGSTLDVASAYFAAMETDTALSIAELNADIQQRTLRAQQARKQAGAATDIDVAQAQNTYQQAQATLADARTQRVLAYNSLASLLGQDIGKLAPVTTTPTLHTLEHYLGSADQTNAQLVAARGAVTLAQAQYDASNNDFSPKSAIQQAQDTLGDARRQVQETRRTLDLAVRSAHANAQAAIAALANARDADATAQANLESAKAQLDAGSISPLAYQNDQLTRQQAAQTLDSAQHAVILKIYTLAQVVAGT
jgi:outer membrane protein TolC